jgi:hypothetical protein
MAPKGFTPDPIEGFHPFSELEKYDQNDVSDRVKLLV